MNDFEDWLSENEYEKMAEFLENRNLTSEFHDWAYIDFCSISFSCIAEALEEQRLEERRMEDKI